ncbi:daptide-type RiPP biosynthesis dehydogenase [Williamsia sp. MIQD14]|uniref:daptide-type RiPP biosynthesis dehydogenase n=1 Tax=Williamsia sp. MIQD14 TaxID=3425703 RepID=UPI003DA1B1B5
MLIGVGGMSRWLQDRRAHRVVVVADPAVCDTAVARELRAAITWAGATVDVVATPADTAMPGVEVVADHLAGRDVVVSLGGGATLDVVKVAVAMSADPRVRRHFDAAGRSGVIFLRDTTTPVIRHVAVPTTIGTGSERGPRACLVLGGRKRLLFGTALQPDLAVLDPVATATLPAHLVLEGVMENVVRQSGAFIGDVSPDGQRIEDELVLTVIRRAIAVGDRLCAGAADGAMTADDRLEAAKLSAWAQSAEFTSPSRDPFANKGWYLSNELSTMFSARKIAAFAAVIPPWWRRVADGDRRWGSAQRLARLWAEIGSVRAVDADPVQGFRALVDDWGITTMPPISGDDASRAARQCLDAWGRGLPALGTLDHSDIEGVMADLRR